MREMCYISTPSQKGLFRVGHRFFLKTWSPSLPISNACHSFKEWHAGPNEHLRLFRRCKRLKKKNKKNRTRTRTRKNKNKKCYPHQARRRRRRSVTHIKPERLIYIRRVGHERPLNTNSCADQPTNKRRVHESCTKDGTWLQHSPGRCGQAYEPPTMRMNEWHASVTCPQYST